MSTKQDHINLLLEKYRLRTISDTERHELEKAALDDSFLFDALEGFAKYDHLNDHYVSDDINKGKNIFRLWPFMAAASLILIASLWLFNEKTKVSSSNETIAMDMAGEEATTNPITIEEKELDETPPNSTTAIGNASQSVVDRTEKKEERPKSRPYASQSSAQSNAGSVEEKKAQSDLESKQSSADNDGLEQSEETSRQNIFISQIDGVNVSVVAIDAASPLAKKMKSKIEPSNNIIEQAAVYPNMGIENLQRMMNMKKEVPLAAFRDNFHGEVEVHFTVNTDGTLSDFKINETECNECGEEVIRLLKLSGKWSTLPKGLKKESSIKVKF